VLFAPAPIARQRQGACVTIVLVVVRPFKHFPRIALGVAGLLAAAYVVSLLLVASPLRLHLLGNLLQTAIIFWAAICALAVARCSSGYLRQLWNLWVAALGTLSAATAMVTYLASFRATPAATAWPSDVLNFLWVSPAIMMFLPWSAEERGRAKWQYALDFMQVGIVVLTATLYFFYVPATWEVEGQGMFALLRNVTVARDVLLAAAFGVRAATLPPNGVRRFFARMGGLFAVVAAFDFIGMSDLGTFTRAAEWVSASWCVPYLLATALAATWNPGEQDAPAPPAREGGWAASHVFPIGIPLLVILMGPRIAREQMTIAWTTIGVSFACSAARLVLTNAGQRRIAEDLQQTQRALRSSEMMFSTAFHASPDAMNITLIPEGGIVELNESFERLTGYSREEALGKTTEQLGLWEDWEQFEQVRMRFRERGVLRDEEFRFRRKGGEIRFGRMSATTMTLDGRLCGLVIVTDVTEKKRAEESVRASEERFRSLVRDLQVGVALVGPNEHLLFSNPANREMFGWKEDDYLGKSVGEMGLTALREDGAPLPLSERPVARAIATRQPVRGEVMGWKRPGSDDVLWMIGNAIPLLNADGGVESVLASFADITALRKTQEALQVSEQRFRTLVQILRVGVSTWGPDGRCRYANQALLEMFHIPEDRLLGKTSGDVAVAIGEDGAEIPVENRPVARAIATGRPVRGMVLGWLLPESKEIIWTQADASPEFAPDGSVARVVASLTDITDRKRADEARRISQEMFTKAFRSSPDSMTISTLADGRYLEVNEGYTQMFGWTREEAIGKTTLELGVWPDAAARERMRTELADRGSISRREFALRNKAGQLRTILISADVIELDGRPCMLAVSDDITEWKAAQEALRFSEERFRTLVENLAVAVVLHGPDGRIRFVNQAAQAEFGLRSEHVLGKKPSEIGLVFLNEDGTEITEAMHPIARVMATGEPIQSLVMGWRWHDRDDVLWIFGSVVPQFGPDGKIAAVIASCANITEQKRAEESLRQLSTRLLQLQDEERRRLGRDLHDSLAQSVLAVNLSLAQVTKSDTRLDERSRTLLGQARALLQDMSRQIRTLSYLLHPPLLDELGLASAVKEYAQGFSERSGIQVEVETSTNFQRLPQETETALFRVVQESLSNIQRHSGSKTARIVLDGTARRILLEVCDHGRGLPQRREKELNAPGASLGVGILGMRERMAQLGGALEIASGRSGTTIRATLPLKTEALDAVAHIGR